MSSGSPSVPVPTAKGVILWLVRHAEVEAAYQNVFGGRIDMNLSPRGEEQAAALGAYLRGKEFAGIYASPMRRARQTLAQLPVNGWPSPEILEDLREIDFGAWTGHAWHDIPAKFGVRAFDWLKQVEGAAIPEAECAERLRRRIDPCLSTMLTHHPAGQVLVLCHGGVIRVMLSLLLGLPLAAFSAIEIEYASVTQVSCSPGRNRLELLNFTPWRDLPV